MKYLVLAAGFAAALGFAQAVQPAQAQSDEVKRICYNKYAIPYTERANASEQRRKDSQAKYNACVRSGGKS